MQGQKSPERSAPRVYVGIDVCKDWLDVYLHPVGKAFRVANAPEGLRAIGRRLARLAVERIVMEATAKFHRQAHRTLHAQGFAVAVVNPLRAWMFVITTITMQPAPSAIDSIQASRLLSKSAIDATTIPTSAASCAHS